MLDKELLNQLYRFAISLTNNDDQAYDLLQTCVEKYLKANLADIEMPFRRCFCSTIRSHRPTWNDAARGAGAVIFMGRGRVHHR